MKSFYMILLSLVLISCTQNNSNKDLLVFELRLAESETNPNLKEMVLLNSDQTFFVSDSVFLSNNDLISAEVVDQQTHPKVKVLLNENGREKFAAFSLNNVGKNAAMIVDHKLVSAPRINAQIDQGLLLIVGYFDLKEAKKIAGGIVISK